MTKLLSSNSAEKMKSAGCNWQKSAFLSNVFKEIKHDVTGKILLINRVLSESSAVDFVNKLYPLAKNSQVVILFIKLFIKWTTTVRKWSIIREGLSQVI